MRTVYALWRRPTEGGSYEKTAEYEVFINAAARTGYPDIGAWREVTEGSWTLDEAGLKGDPWLQHTQWLIAEEKAPDTDADRIQLAIDLAVECGGYDGEHHKMWVIDQIVRVLAGDRYAEVLPEGWDEGIAP